MPKTLIVMPLQKEFGAFCEYLFAEGFQAESVNAKTDAIWIPELGIVVAVAGHGKAQFAVATQYLIDSFGPFGLVIVAGAAGALDVNLRPGEIVIGTETIEHDYKMRFDGNVPVPRYAGSPEARAGIERVHAQNSSIRLHSGAIASGDEDIVDTARAQELRRQTDALCVAWEGAGGAKAAQFNGIPFLEIRAITDAADGDAPDNYRVHLADAVINIGRLLLPWLRGQR